MDFFISNWTETDDDDSDGGDNDDAGGWDDDEPPAESTDKNRDFPAGVDGNGNKYVGGAACSTARPLQLARVDADETDVETGAVGAGRRATTGNTPRTATALFAWLLSLLRDNDAGTLTGGGGGGGGVASGGGGDGSARESDACLGDDAAESGALMQAPIVLRTRCQTI